MARPAPGSSRARRVWCGGAPSSRRRPSSSPPPPSSTPFRSPLARLAPAGGPGRPSERGRPDRLDGPSASPRAAAPLRHRVLLPLLAHGGVLAVGAGARPPGDAGHGRDGRRPSRDQRRRAAVPGAERPPHRRTRVVAHASRDPEPGRWRRLRVLPESPRAPQQPDGPDGVSPPGQPLGLAALSRRRALAAPARARARPLGPERCRPSITRSRTASCWSRSGSDTCCSSPARSAGAWSAGARSGPAALALALAPLLAPYVAIHESLGFDRPEELADWFGMDLLSGLDPGGFSTLYRGRLVIPPTLGRGPVPRLRGPRAGRGRSAPRGSRE